MLELTMMKSIIFHVSGGRIFLAILYLLSVAHIICHGEAASTNNQDNQPPNSRIVQSLFRFPASKLGPEFDELLQNWYTDALYATNDTLANKNNTPIITPDQSGKSHALKSVSAPAATLFRRQCYTPYPQTSTLHHNLYKNYEQRRKEISFQYNKDSKEEMRLMHTMTKRFYPALLPEEKGGDTNNKRMHKKKSTSTVNTIHAQSTLPADYDAPSNLSFQTGLSSSKSNEEEEDVNNNEQQQQWSWYPPAHFSSRGTPSNMPFRMKMYKAMRDALQERIQQLIPNFTFDKARQSGMFWYPPGGVREWHTNRLDLVGNTNGGEKTKVEDIFASQTWRMYFVRTVRDSEFDKKLTKLRKGVPVDTSSNDHSALHLIPGDDIDGITLDVLEKAGARRLTNDEEKRQYSDEFAEDYTPTGKIKSDESTDLDSNVFDRNAVWRLPDVDGYITLFRIPDLWHCIVSEEVHRYSLGFAFSDKEVQALLTLVDADFDTTSGNKEDADKVDIKDEL